MTNRSALPKGMSLEDWLTHEAAEDGTKQAVASMATACAEITHIIRELTLEGTGGAISGIVNIQGETQLALDVRTNEHCLYHLAKAPSVSLIVSEEIDHVIANEGAGSEANLAVCFDPLDGSANVEVHAAVGTIFSVLELDNSVADTTARVLGATRRQVAAGYALYGSATMLMLTTGHSVAQFALHEPTSTFRLVADHITIAPAAKEFSINMSYGKYWPQNVRAYIDECLLGKEGPRGKTFNMRWAGAMVADVHRVFMKGGHFIYPALSKAGSEQGKLRLLYEGIPMAMLVETAGGAAMAGQKRLADAEVTHIHQRTPVSLGAREEVERLASL